MTKTWFLVHLCGKGKSCLSIAFRAEGRQHLLLRIQIFPGR
ncbi:hypothetical protein E2C01_099443 [Portunus trituberculatus]|uniref:Uncharacterized protein n=1 Tax=Portunus trituberculatus TaxID=210409 RepID=A0A5B7KEY2_PORTR|nr:hypothetical protein [Portunus trituberculatus]